MLYPPIGETGLATFCDVLFQYQISLLFVILVLAHGLRIGNVSFPVVTSDILKLVPYYEPFTPSR